MAEIVSIKDAKKPKQGPIKGLLLDWQGHPKPTLGNVVLLLQQDVAWRGVFSFDLHAGRVRKEKPLPSREHDTPSAACPATPFLEDSDIDLVCLYLERKHRTAVPGKIAFRGIVAVARSQARDPIKDYLDGLKWDGKKRLDKWLIDLVAADDSPYVRAIGAKWMISAVARVYQPAAQVDHVLIIEGEQRGGKSSALRALCPNEEWFLSTTVDIGNKDAYQVISAKWLVEFAELGSMSRSIESKVKAFITDRVDTYRQAYAHLVIDQKRRCVFAATVNPGAGQGYLKDATGGGRWWPFWSNSDIRHRLDIEAIEKARDQLWAEATARYKEGEAWHLVDPDLIEAAAAAQAERRVVHPLESRVAAFLDDPGWRESGVSVARVLQEVCGEHVDRLRPQNSMEIADILTTLGWRYGRRGSQVVGGRRLRERLYFPIEAGDERFSPGGKAVQLKADQKKKGGRSK